MEGKKKGMEEGGRNGRRRAKWNDRNIQMQA
jgi:hypothetical protein